MTIGFDQPTLGAFLVQEAFTKESTKILILAMQESHMNGNEMLNMLINGTIRDYILACKSPVSEALGLLEFFAVYAKAPNGKHFPNVGYLLALTLQLMRTEGMPSTYLQRMQTCIHNITL